MSAIVALATVVAVLAVVVVSVVQRPLVLLVAIVGLGVAIVAAAYALTRTGARRLLAAAVAVLALAAPLALLVAYGRLPQLLLLIVLAVLAGTATRYGLGRDLSSLKSGPTPGAAVGPATRPVLLMNPKSGGGKVERFHLVKEARRRGIEPIVLAPGDDLGQLARQAVEQGADVLGMAGGDGSQALVAGVAMAHGVGFVMGSSGRPSGKPGLRMPVCRASRSRTACSTRRRRSLGFSPGLSGVKNCVMRRARPAAILVACLGSV